MVEPCCLRNAISGVSWWFVFPGALLSYARYVRTSAETMCQNFEPFKLTFCFIMSLPCLVARIGTTLVP